MRPEDVTLATGPAAPVAAARRWARTRQNGEPVAAHNGRYGPYVQCGDETRSLPGGAFAAGRDAGAGPGSAGPAQGGRGAAAAASRSAVFDASPVTGQPVHLLTGRYGPYVTDGTTNASLPRGTVPEQVTFEQALDLLAARAAQGPVAAINPPEAREEAGSREEEEGERGRGGEREEKKKQSRKRGDAKKRKHEDGETQT